MVSEDDPARKMTIDKSKDTFIIGLNFKDKPIFIPDINNRLFLFYISNEEFQLLDKWQSSTNIVRGNAEMAAAVARGIAFIYMIISFIYYDFIFFLTAIAYLFLGIIYYKYFPRSYHLLSILLSAVALFDCFRRLPQEGWNFAFLAIFPLFDLVGNIGFLIVDPFARKLRE